MARVPSLKRIQKEDFDKEIQPTIEKLAFPLNSFMEQTRSALDGNLDFTNLNQEIIVLDIVVAANGIPSIDSKFKSNLKSKCIGVSCLNTQNLTSPAIYPTSGVTLTTSQNGDIVTVNHVTGLVANYKYRLTLLSLGA